MCHPGESRGPRTGEKSCETEETVERHNMHCPWIPAFAGMTGMGYATFVDFDVSRGFKNCPV